MRALIGARIQAAVAVAMIGASLVWVVRAQPRGGPIAIDPDDIGGVVTSAKGGEAGVWVIAETTDLPTKFTRIVVTDDQGRYVVPDLPRANYQVFVRGYGLVDSQRQPAKPGQTLNLTAVVAPDAKAAADVYPAGWWLAMVPQPEGLEGQLRFQQNMKGCLDCHHVGSKATREMNPVIAKEASSTLDGWDRRTRVGPSGPVMSGDFQRFGDHRKMFADWTDRIAKGEVPKVAPPRPKGVERNLVVTLWDWGSPIDGRADNVASDVRDPTINANGPIFGVSQMNDALNVLDPLEHKASIIKVPTSAPPLVSSFNAAPNPSPYWGADMWKRLGDPRSVGIDGKGRVWVTVRLRDAKQQPSWCGGNGANAFGKYFPIGVSGKQVAVFDQKTQKFENIDTCFTVDHNEIDHDGFIYYGNTGMVGWVDTKAWDRTHNAEQSQGWCPAVIDTNGDGRITPGWTEPDQPVDPARDHRITFGCYAIAVNPKDQSIWCSGIGNTQRALVRIDKGSNPPQTCKAEIYTPPNPAQGLPITGSGGVAAGNDGLIWQAWRVSGHLTSFDRTKCKSTKDPKASGESCAEGWTVYRNTAEPTYSTSAFKSSESYLLHIDAHDTLGLGNDSPIYGSVNTDSYELFSTATKQFVTLRVPYPHGFFPRSGNGRIDDRRAGWKGKGFWGSYATYASWHIEGGKGTLPKAVKFQMRPDPLAK